MTTDAITAPLAAALRPAVAPEWFAGALASRPQRLPQHRWQTLDAPGALSGVTLALWGGRNYAGEPTLYAFCPARLQLLTITAAAHDLLVQCMQLPLLQPVNGAAVYGDGRPWQAQTPLPFAVLARVDTVTTRPIDYWLEAVHPTLQRSVLAPITACDENTQRVTELVASAADGSAAYFARLDGDCRSLLDRYARDFAGDDGYIDLPSVRLGHLT